MRERKAQAGARVVRECSSAVTCLSCLPAYAFFGCPLHYNNNNYYLVAAWKLFFGLARQVDPSHRFPLRQANPTGFTKQLMPTLHMNDPNTAMQVSKALVTAQVANLEGPLQTPSGPDPGAQNRGRGGPWHGWRRG